MNSIRAWLLDAGQAQRIAVGEQELVEVLQDAPVRYVPVKREGFRNALVWRSRVIPALDLGGFGAEPGEIARRKAAVLAFQRGPGEPVQYGALLLREYPVSIRVDDSMAKFPILEEIPFANWIVACFQWQEHPVWVVDPARVFGVGSSEVERALPAALGSSTQSRSMPVL